MGFQLRSIRPECRLSAASLGKLSKLEFLAITLDPPCQASGRGGREHRWWSGGSVQCGRLARWSYSTLGTHSFCGPAAGACVHACVRVCVGRSIGVGSASHASFMPAGQRHGCLPSRCRGISVADGRLPPERHCLPLPVAAPHGHLTRTPRGCPDPPRIWKRK